MSESFLKMPLECDERLPKDSIIFKGTPHHGFIIGDRISFHDTSFEHLIAVLRARRTLLDNKYPGGLSLPADADITPVPPPLVPVPFFFWRPSSGAYGNSYHHGGRQRGTPPAPGGIPTSPIIKRTKKMLDFFVYSRRWSPRLYDVALGLA